MHNDATNINPYLVDGPDVVLQRVSSPLCNIPALAYGSKPVDGGNLLLSESERIELLAIEPNAEQWIRAFMGSEELINGIPRYCHWLKNCPPDELRKMPAVMERINAVKEMRINSSKQPTRQAAATPAVFAEIRQSLANYVAIPEVSSERRNFVPIGFYPSTTIASNLLYVLPNATFYHFGILSSTMHNSWMRAVCGRLKSDYRYSAGIVYNNFPWPDVGVVGATALPRPPLGGNGNNGDDCNKGDPPGSPLQERISSAAQAVLDARAKFPTSTLADLYDPLSMPPELVKAHQALDRAVDAAYACTEPGRSGKTAFKTEAERVAFLFERYQQLTVPLAAIETKKTAKVRATRRLQE